MIPQTQREQLVALLHEFSEEYSPWAVLLVFADTMRDVFRRMEHDEAMEGTARPWCPACKCECGVILGTCTGCATPVEYR